MEEGHSWKATSSSASHKILCIFWSSKVHYIVHNSLPLVPILSQIKTVNALRTNLRHILIIPYYLSLGLPSGLLPSGSSTKTQCIFSLPIRATCRAHRTLISFISRIVFGVEYKPYSSLLCSFLQPPVTANLLAPNIFLSTPTPYEYKGNCKHSLNLRSVIRHMWQRLCM
jgi:hypothetical protein